jgi:uncharacterized membrane protein (UPF0127 family)
VLINRTTGDALARQVTRCDTFWRRLRGLMFHRRLTLGQAYLFDFRRESVVAPSIHMMFVFYPISLIWLDGRRQVVDARLARPFRPWYAPRRAARYLIEGRPELLGRVHLGDELEYIEC